MSRHPWASRSSACSVTASPPSGAPGACLTCCSSRPPGSSPTSLSKRSSPPSTGWVAGRRNSSAPRFGRRASLVAPLDRANVDTDQIIPKQFLKSIKRSGFGVNLFDAWRYTDHGEPGMDHAKRPLNQDFVLSQPRYRGAAILLARKNFG